MPIVCDLVTSNYDTLLQLSVTAVGGTTGIAPEVAVSHFYSGGGFSNYVWSHDIANNTSCSALHQFPQPTYQKDAVRSYIGTIPQGTYQDLYNPLSPVHFGIEVGFTDFFHFSVDKDE